MKNLILYRSYKDEATLGVLVDENNQNICLTLERPNLNNQNGISCIVEGTYHVIWSHSSHLKKETFEILNVPNRSGIRIHCANYADELEGCIATATTIQDMNPTQDPHKDTLKKWYASQSRDAMQKLIQTIGEAKEFQLKIIAKKNG